MQELDFGERLISYLTQVPFEQVLMETLELSIAIPHQITPTWDSGSHHKDWISRGISPTPSPFSSTMVLATPVLILFSYIVYPHNHSHPLMKVSTPA